MINKLLKYIILLVVIIIIIVITVFKLFLLEIRTKHCWVCFGTEDDEFEGSNDWVSPCKCRGSAQWVIILLYINIYFFNSIVLTF